MTPNLTDMPDVVLRQIFTDVGCPGILNLRKVCQSFRKFLQEFPTDSRIPRINITIYHNLMIIKLQPGILEIDGIRYSKEGANCNIRYGNWEKVLENCDYSNRVFEDLEIIFAHQKSVLNSLEIFCPIPDIRETEFPEKVQRLQKVLENSRKLKVKKFYMLYSEFSHISSLLKHLDAGIIEEIATFSMMKPYENDNEIEEFVKLDHWKNLKRIKIYNVPIEISLQYFLHFKEVTVEFTRISAEEMILVMENFFNSSFPEEFYIGYTDFDDEIQFLNYLGPPRTFIEDYEMYQRKWYKRIGNSSEALFIFQSKADDNFFKFSRIPLSDVP
ncbi:hypothetical protein B9Z55_020847 [Caenorhabditis nigoni]|uniref:F-box domain-containing protein n=1 Tax=Caenorhabditis nigoni TaxID=1611254 RepID=A0A2G5TPD1_9PELO|nr:hypothetical protein B9Z55_020847 [Caenorhabditis nigoni]